MKINNLVEKQFIESLKIDTSKNYKLFHECGKKLLINSRIDIIPKLCYLESYINNYKTKFFENLYKSSIEVFSNGNFKEPGNKNKNSFDKYKEIFIKLNNEISKNGFNENKSIFIKGTNNAILDGGHRAAIAYYHNLHIPYIIIDNAKVNYNIDYFKNRYMDIKYLDYICLDYIKRKENVFSICLWQTLNNKQKSEAINYIKDKLDIIYSKDIYFNYNGLKNFMVEIYGHQKWLGNYKNHFHGVYKKVDNCFKKGRQVTCLVVEARSSEEVLKIKKELRDIFKLGNHSIHSTDNKIETIDMLSLLLNDNSIEVLNRYNFERYISFYNDVNEILNKQQDNNDKHIIFGDILLKMCGIKDSNKYDFFDHDLNNNDYDEFIFDPSNYFYFHGLKFLTLENYKSICNLDHKDLKLINSFTKNKRKNLCSYGLKIKRYGRKVRGVLISFLKKLKIDKPIKNIYLKVKRNNE